MSCISVEYVSQLGRVKKTTIQMMQDRDYTVPDSDLQLLSKDDLLVGCHFVNKAEKQGCSLAESMVSLYSHKTLKKLCVYFLDRNYDEDKCREKMISSEQIRTASLKWKKLTKNVLLIFPCKPSPEAKKELLSIKYLLHDFLWFPVGRHSMVPPHSLVNNFKEFYTTRKIEPEHLPILRSTDPIAIYYDFPLGSLVKIQRPGWTVYRVVQP